MTTELSQAEETTAEPVSTPRYVSERALKAAQEIRARWEAEQERSPLDRVVANEFRTRRYLNAGERRAVSELIYSSVRMQRRDLWLLEKMGQEATAARLIALAAALGGWQRMDNSDFGFDAGALAAALNALPDPSTPADYLRISLSLPDDLADSLESLLGPEAPAAAQAFNTQAPVTLRLNPLRVSRQHLSNNLPESAPTRYSPWGVELPRRVNITEVQGFRAGWFEVQEEASQIAAFLVDALPGQSVVEIGAGAGGKTLALGAQMESRGEILAIDTHAGRLEELQKRAERAGVTCVETALVRADVNGDWQPTASVRRALNKRLGLADAVLIDAPCTGSGVLRRSPDAKWREFHLASMTRLQANLIRQAALFVKPGGTLTYITCAFEREQNEAIVEEFLQTEFGQQFTLLPAGARLLAACQRATRQALLPISLRSPKNKRHAGLPDEATLALPEETAAALQTLTTGPYLRTWPHRHNLDAFFGACLQRQFQAGEIRSERES